MVQDVEVEKEFGLTPRQATLLLKHYENQEIPVDEVEELHDLLDQIGEHHWTVEYGMAMAKKVLSSK